MRLKQKNSGLRVQFEKHQPEHWSGLRGNPGCCCGCCCCCCCLHTLGGLIGATAVALKGKSAAERSAAGSYWFCLAIFTSMDAAIFARLFSKDSSPTFGIII